jgi:ribosome-associated protein
MSNYSNGLAYLDVIAQTIFDKKGFNILTLDARNVSTLTDFFVFAEGSVDRHVKALGRAIVDKLKQDEGLVPLHVEGEKEGDWLVVDYGYVIVHLFTPGMREKYAIEQLLRNAKIVETKIVVPENNASLKSVPL